MECGVCHGNFPIQEITILQYAHDELCDVDLIEVCLQCKVGLLKEGCWIEA